jgi:microcin C transport system substrate-binding protein
MKRFFFGLMIGLSGFALTLPASAQKDDWVHALALMGTPAYTSDFKHFNYVNPNAPKGGTARLARQGGFDNFNPVVAGVKGQLDGGVFYVYETLTTQSFDEISTAYGLLAEAMKHPPDFSSVTYRLRAEARWHDGKPVTPEDVVFSFNAFKKHSPSYAFYWSHVVKAEQTGPREVTFTFDQPGNRELPQIVGQLTVLPKHWWTGKDAQGKPRDITQTTLEKPLGSGPYRLRSFDPQRATLYERVPDYWGRHLPVRIGQNNFDELRFEYFRDTTVMFEAFKGDQIDFRFENSAKNWASGYDFAAVKDGRVIREEFPERAVGRMQAFVFNLRRDKFKDQRVRRAFNYAFDFEDMNKTIFYGQYERISSYFAGTELASSGIPQGLEKDLLLPFANDLPPDLFTKPYVNPKGGSPDATRKNLREADRLLREAGWVIKDGKRVNAKNERFHVEFLVDDPTSERYILFYKPGLEKLGISVGLRVVDASQYENRIRDFDFDITNEVWGQSLSPGNEQRDYWGSQAANRPGSRNLGGIKDPVIDALIEKVIFATNREELVAATQALDRVLMWRDYVVPQWSYYKTRTARWNRFVHPHTMPEYQSPAFPFIWWYDDNLANKTGGRR